MVSCLPASVPLADHPISTPPIGPAPASASLSAVAPLGNAFLALWTEAPWPGDYRLRAIRVDAGGEPVHPPQFLGEEETSSPPFLVTGGRDGVGVAWAVQ